MNRLSGLDAFFLYMETPETPMHVGSVTTFGPGPTGVDLFAAFREHTAARLDLLPSYTRRLAPTPLGLDHPAWVNAPNIDLDHHIRHLALPRPGSMPQLRDMVARLHATPLDRRRPLWEYYFIEGLENDGFAIYAKAHHSAMDGVAGLATLQVVFDFRPDAEPMKRLPMPPAPVEETDFLEMTSTAVADLLRHGVRAVRSLPSLVRSAAAAAPSVVRDARYLYAYAKGTPRTPLNVAISGERIYATASLPLPEVKALAKSRGVTINDIVMAVSAGAMRRFLLDREALPDEPLIAGVPASIRPADDAKMNNQVVFTLSRLPTHIGAPLPRLAAAAAAGAQAKTLFADVRDLLTTDITVIGAPLLVSGAARLYSATRAANFLPWSLNVIVSNVPGPRTPMYCVGAAATHYFPVSIPFHGCALNITVQSYLDRLDFGLIACRKTVPEAQQIADYVVEDFRALSEADAALNRPDAIGFIDITRPRALLIEEAGAAGEAPKPPPRPKAQRAAPKLANLERPVQHGRAKSKREAPPSPEAEADPARGAADARG